MIKRVKIIKEIEKKKHKSSFIIYMILRTLVLLCMVREIMNGNFQNALLCVFSLGLFLLPSFAEKKFKIELPNLLEIIIMLFIFSAEILGEINNFYGIYPNFDTILHTINGFLCASIGFSLVYLLNKNIESFQLSPIFICLVAFTFSMTIGVLWETFEYGMDKYFNLDMQKDTFVNEINTVLLDETLTNKVVSINNIDKTIIYDKNNTQIATFNGYIDIGLNDTMEDLFVNLIGAVIFSILGYLYLLNEDKYKLAGKFLTKRKSN